MLGLSRPTIRSDLSLLVMLDVLNAKPKVGYFPGPALESKPEIQNLFDQKVGDVQSVPVMIREKASVQDAVVAMFTENVGTLIVCGDDGTLSGVVSRKDLLKFTLGNPGAAEMPVSLVMTREPNVVTVTPEHTVLDAARLMIRHDVDSLPVLSGDPKRKSEVMGRISKTTVTRIVAALRE